MLKATPTTRTMIMLMNMKMDEHINIDSLVCFGPVHFVASLTTLMLAVK